MGWDLRLHFQCLQHQDRFPQVPTRVLCDFIRRCWWQIEPDVLGHLLQNRLDLEWQDALATANPVGEVSPTSPGLGAATRMSKHRLLMGAINREVLLAQRIIRRFVMYFSMVLRSAA